MVKQLSKANYNQIHLTSIERFEGDIPFYAEELIIISGLHMSPCTQATSNVLFNTSNQHRNPKRNMLEDPGKSLSIYEKQVGIYVDSFFSMIL